MAFSKNHRLTPRGAICGGFGSNATFHYFSEMPLDPVVFSFLYSFQFFGKE